MARRHALRVEYDRLCAAGELRPLTYRERLTAKARGNSDREDVKAAMRLCIKKVGHGIFSGLTIATTVVYNQSTDWRYGYAHHLR